jgi:hypothetical protein
MTFQAENFAEHYKAVRARLWPTQPKAAVTLPALPPPAKRRHAAERYTSPIGPVRPGRRIYAMPIGPKWQFYKAPAKARKIILEIAAKHGLHPAEMLSRRRQAHLIVARHEAWLAVHDEFYPHWSIAACARFFGVDHTSMLHALCKRRERQAFAQSPESFVEGLG